MANNWAKTKPSEDSRIITSTSNITVEALNAIIIES